MRKNSDALPPLHRNVKRLTALLLALSLGGVVVLVLLLTRQQANDLAQLPAAATVVPMASLKNLDLSYPGATKLAIDAKDLWPNGQPNDFEGWMLGAMATNDDYKQVISYYKQKLPLLGFPVSGNDDSFTCNDEDCDNSATIYVQNSQASIEIAAINGSDLAQIDEMPASLKKAVSANQTLVTYYINPIQPTPTLNPAALTAQAATPTPPAPATPVSAGTFAFIGADNRFHAGSDLTTLKPSAKQNLQDNISFQIDWLQANATGTTLQITTITSGSNKSAYSMRDTPIGTLTDDKGRTYTFHNGDWLSSGNSNEQHQQVIWHADALPDDVHQVVFKAGDGLAVKPQPIALTLVNYAHSGLPKVAANPNAFSSMSGLNLSVPYAYFGPDRTVILLNLSRPSNGGALQGLGLLSYGNEQGDNLEVVDDKNQLIQQLPNAGIQPPGGGEALPPLMIEPNGDVTLILQPIKPGTQTVHVKLNKMQIVLTPAYTPAMPSFAVDIDQLLKSNTPQVGPTLEIQGYKFEVTSEKATLDTASKKVTLELQILPENGTNIEDLSVDCPNCGPTEIIGGGSVPAGQPYDFKLTLNYALNTKITIQMDKLVFNLTGAWQVDLPTK